MTGKEKALRAELWFLFSWLIFLDTLPLSSVGMIVANLVCSVVLGFLVADVITRILIVYKEWWRE